MEKFKHVLQSGTGFVITTATILVLIVLFSLIIGGIPGKPSGEPLAGQTATDNPTEAYPPPDDQNPPTPVWTDTAIPLPTSTIEEGASLPDTPPVGAGRAATLFKGDVWMVEAGSEPQQLTGFGDVSAIFGLNWDGMKLLIGRGRIVQPEFTGDTTDLWILDLHTAIAHQFTASGLVQSAAWSPVDDRIAYCELEGALIVASPEGEILHQNNQALCEFTWSPDGAAIAVKTYSTYNTSDGYNTLGVWWLSTNSMQTFYEAKDEVHLQPIWSMDNCCILFLKISFDPALKDMYWWHIVNITTGEMKTLENTPKYAQQISRSSYSNTVTFQSGEDIYVMDFDGNYQFIGKGRAPIWLSDGRSLIYQEQSNSNYLSRSIDITIEEIPKGGQSYSINLYEEMSPK